MADWKTVRFDPTYEESLDAPIVPLCDALQAAGFNTLSSCCGHGHGWPHVFWDDSAPDARCEALARFLLAKAGGDYRPSRPEVAKCIQEVGHTWMLEIHVHGMYANTPVDEAMRLTIEAINATAEHVAEFAGTGGKP